MAFDYDLPAPPCARGRFCEVETPSGLCPCADPDSLAAELRDIAEEMRDIQSAQDDLSWEQF